MRWGFLLLTVFVRDDNNDAISIDRRPAALCGMHVIEYAIE